MGRRARSWMYLSRALRSLATAVALVLATAGAAAADDPATGDLVTSDVTVGTDGEAVPTITEPAPSEPVLPSGVPAPPSWATEQPVLPAPVPDAAVDAVNDAGPFGDGAWPPAPAVTQPTPDAMPSAPAAPIEAPAPPAGEPVAAAVSPETSAEEIDGPRPAADSAQQPRSGAVSRADHDVRKERPLPDVPEAIAPATGPALAAPAPSSSLVSGPRDGERQLATAPTATVVLELLRQSPAAAVAVALPSALTSGVSVAVEFGRLGHGWAGGIVFNAWLRRQLRERRMSQRQLAQLAGVDHSTISRLLNGRTPSLDTATRLARALGAAFPEGIPYVVESTPEQTALPTARVERALRGDEDLEDEDIRRVMDTYLSLRARRRRLRTSGGSGARAQH